jgi:hypothetical protein
MNMGDSPWSQTAVPLHITSNPRKIKEIDRAHIVGAHIVTTMASHNHPTVAVSASELDRGHHCQEWRQVSGFRNQSLVQTLPSHERLQEPPSRRVSKRSSDDMKTLRLTSTLSCFCLQLCGYLSLKQRKKDELKRMPIEKPERHAQGAIFNSCISCSKSR